MQDLSKISNESIGHNLRWQKMSTSYLDQVNRGALINYFKIHTLMVPLLLEQVLSCGESTI